jgi:Flp pilus assembly protein TadG
VKKEKKSNVCSEKGQSLVEFAFTLVLLLILVVGIADLGRALFTYLSLRDGAQEGALYGSVVPTGDITERVYQSSNYLQDLGNAGEISVTVTHDGTPCTGEPITVLVTYSNFTITMPFLGALVGSQSIPISAVITDTILAPKCD